MTSDRYAIGALSALDIQLNFAEQSKDIIVLFDGDALFFKNAAAGQIELPATVRQDDVFKRLHAVYYFDLRNSLAVVPKLGANPDPAELAATRKSIFKSIAGQAARLALEQTQTGKPFQPPWLDVFIDAYRKYMPDQLQSLLSSVNLKVVHDGYMTARVDKRHNVILSSKLKSFLTVWNTLLLLSERDGLTGTSFNTALAYCLQPEIDFDLMRLPLIVAPDTVIFQSVRKLTTAQIQFLLLHELGHEYYDHNNIAKPRPLADDEYLRNIFGQVSYQLYQEHEADAFALREVLNSISADIDGATDLFAKATDFLFSFIICFEATARVVRAMRSQDIVKAISVFEDRQRVLRQLETKYGWKSLDGQREADIYQYRLLAEAFTTSFLERLQAMPSHQLADEIQHRKGA